MAFHFHILIVFLNSVHFIPVPKPGYGLSYTSPRAATLPVAGMYGARDYVSVHYNSVYV